MKEIVRFVLLCGAWMTVFFLWLHTVLYPWMNLPPMKSEYILSGILFLMAAETLKKPTK